MPWYIKDAQNMNNMYCICVPPNFNHNETGFFSILSHQPANTYKTRNRINESYHVRRLFDWIPPLCLELFTPTAHVKQMNLKEIQYPEHQYLNSYCIVTVFYIDLCHLCVKDHVFLILKVSWCLYIFLILHISPYPGEWWKSNREKGVLKDPHGKVIQWCKKTTWVGTFCYALRIYLPFFW